MFPCAIRRRSASGVMSTISTWSAARTIASGTVSRCGTPVIFSTTSLRDSRCWMLTAEITSIPASSSSSMSCQRFSLREPGTLVCANSSTRAISGRRASTASRSISSKARAAVLQPGPGDGFQAVEQRDGLRARVRLGEPHDDVGATLGAAVPLAEHGVGLAHPGRGSQVNPQMTTPRPGPGGAGSTRARIRPAEPPPSPPGLPGPPPPPAPQPAVTVSHVRPVSFFAYLASSCSPPLTSIVKHGPQTGNSACQAVRRTLTRSMRRANEIHAPARG